MSFLWKLKLGKSSNENKDMKVAVVASCCKIRHYLKQKSTYLSGYFYVM